MMNFNPQLVNGIVGKLKTNGMFDEMRRDCLADIDTKPAFQNLKQRVENYVNAFLSSEVWTPSSNKNQLRAKVRTSVMRSGMLNTGIEHILHQVVDAKMYTQFLPKITDFISENREALRKEFEPATEFMDSTENEDVQMSESSQPDEPVRMESPKVETSRQMLSRHVGENGDEMPCGELAVAPAALSPPIAEDPTSPPASASSNHEENDVQPPIIPEGAANTLRTLIQSLITVKPDIQSLLSDEKRNEDETKKTSVRSSGANSPSIDPSQIEAFTDDEDNSPVANVAGPKTPEEPCEEEEACEEEADSPTATVVSVHSDQSLNAAHHSPTLSPASSHASLTPPHTPSDDNAKDVMYGESAEEMSGNDGSEAGGSSDDHRHGRREGSRREEHDTGSCNDEIPDDNDHSQYFVDEEKSLQVEEVEVGFASNDGVQFQSECVVDMVEQQVEEQEENSQASQGLPLSPMHQLVGREAREKKRRHKRHRRRRHASVSDQQTSSSGEGRGAVAPSSGEVSSDEEIVRVRSRSKHKKKKKHKKRRARVRESSTSPDHRYRNPQPSPDYLRRSGESPPPRGRNYSGGPTPPHRSSFHDAAFDGGDSRVKVEPIFMSHFRDGAGPPLFPSSSSREMGLDGGGHEHAAGPPRDVIVEHLYPPSSRYPAYASPPRPAYHPRPASPPPPRGYYDHPAYYHHLMARGASPPPRGRYSPTPPPMVGRYSPRRFSPPPHHRYPPHHPAAFMTGSSGARPHPADIHDARAPPIDPSAPSHDVMRPPSSPYR